MIVPVTRFRDRADAGRQLAASWLSAPHADVIVLGLARGGVPVACELARALGAPLDVVVVRKLGVPEQPELAMGAVAPRGVRILNEEVLHLFHVPDEVAAESAAREEAEVARRERAYRGDSAGQSLEGRNVVIVDDGLATGASMQAAIASVRRAGATRVEVAVPTGSPETCDELRQHADDVLCLTAPEHFFAVGQSYEDFSETTDDDVRAFLAAAGDSGGGRSTATRAAPPRRGAPG
jgi:predicted phosphoribosyltransferase